MVDEGSKRFVDVVAGALGLSGLRVIETGGGDGYQSGRQQSDSGNNAVAVEPGVVFTYDRNALTHSLLRKAGSRWSRSSVPSWAVDAAAATA